MDAIIKVESKKVKQAQKGQSLVEMALSMVIILTLLAGAVDFGMAFFSYSSLMDAAQEGALNGSLDPSNWGNVENRVRGSSNIPVDLSDVSTVTVSPGAGNGNCRGGLFTVEVSYDYPLSMPFIPAILGSSTITLTARATDTIINDTDPNCP